MLDNPLYVFFLLLIGGESIALPIVYLALLGKFSLVQVLGLIFAATVISDTAWYFAGRLLRIGKLKRLAKLKDKFIKNYANFIETTEPWYLIYSKFIYSTRTLAHVIAGSRNVKLGNYLPVNILAVIIWIGVLILLGTISNKIILSLSLSPVMYQILLGIPFLLLFILTIWLKRYIAKRKYQ